MKKAILIPAFILVFIVGIAMSDLVLNLFNSVFGKDVFTTNHVIEKKMEEKEKLAKANEAAQKKKFDQLANKMTRREANMNSLNKEIEAKVNPALIKQMLLSPSGTGSGPNQRMLLDAQGSESMVTPTTSTDDAAVNQFKQTFNEKAQTIIDVSRGILKEKVGRLNQELRRINNELTDRNVELIGKLKEVEKYKKELEEHKKYITDLEGIKSNLQKTVGILETKIENGRLKVSFKGDILFPSGKHQLRPEGKKLLESVYDILKKSTENNDIFIAGHTDNVPIKPAAREKYESNWTLSTYRAIEVVKYLVEKGMAPQSLTAAGYGEYKPIATNDTDQGKAKNRRVELFLIPKIIKRSTK